MRFELLAYVKYTLSLRNSYFTQKCIFWRMQTLVLWRKIVQNLIFVSLFCPENSRAGFGKTSVTC